MPRSTAAIRFRGFPQELWFLIAEQAMKSNDASELLLLARLSRAMAEFALPRMYGLLYGGHKSLITLEYFEYTSPSKQSVSFWRAILMSALGGTLYPYCCWINTLSFNDLLSFLQGLSFPENAWLRQRFCSPPLGYLRLLKTDTPDGLGPHLLFFELVNKITEGIKATIDQGQVGSRLATVRYPKLKYLPSTLYFPVWVSRLSGLTAVHIHDASLLNEQATLALTQSCPTLRYL